MLKITITTITTNRPSRLQQRRRRRQRPMENPHQTRPWFRPNPGPANPKWECLVSSLLKSTETPRTRFITNRITSTCPYKVCRVVSEKMGIFIFEELYDLFCAAFLVLGDSGTNYLEFMNVSKRKLSSNVVDCWNLHLMKTNTWHWKSVRELTFHFFAHIIKQMIKKKD